MGEGRDPGRRRPRRALRVGLALTLCAVVGAALLSIRPEDKPTLRVETAKPPAAEVAPANRPSGSPEPSTSTTEPSTTTTVIAPPPPAPTSTTATTARRRPPAPSTTATTAKVSTTSTTTRTVDRPVALDRPGLYVARLDGSGLRRVSDDPVGTFPFHPAVSPDGRRLVYVGPNIDVYVMNLADGTTRRLGGPVATGRTGAAPVWSPDSRHVAFPGNGATTRNRDIWIADADGVEPIRVIDHPADDAVVAWGPDGRLASTSDEGIAVYRPDGSGRTIIYSKGLGDPGYVRWSPDGTMVAAIPAGAGVSLVAKADGSGFTEFHHFWTGYGMTGDLGAWEVDWAPTSDRLILAGRTAEPERAPVWRVVKADGTALWTEPASPYPGPDWAPAGEVIASLRDGRIELYNGQDGAHTGTFMPLPSGLTVKSYTWMPDGSAIAFNVDAG